MPPLLRCDPAMVLHQYEWWWYSVTRHEYEYCTSTCFVRRHLGVLGTLLVRTSTVLDGEIHSGEIQAGEYYEYRIRTFRTRGKHRLRIDAEAAPAPGKSRVHVPQTDVHTSISRQSAANSAATEVHSSCSESVRAEVYIFTLRWPTQTTLPRL